MQLITKGPKSGLICLIIGPYNIHLIVKKEYRLWGYQQDWYDGPLHYIGLGPLIMICWQGK